MAKTLKEFPTKISNRRAEFGESPLDKFLDGRIWELNMQDAKDLEKKLSYENVYDSLQKLRTALYNRAKVVGLKTRTRQLDRSIVIQAYKEGTKNAS